jgi:hypothetical protein
MEQFVDDSVVPTQPRSVSLLVTFVVIIGGGVVSWAVVLIGLHFAWTAIRSHLT